MALTVSPVYKGGRTIRDYQVAGLNWMMYNWHKRRNCILADEMGLGACAAAADAMHLLMPTQLPVAPPDRAGKTVQAVSVLDHLKRAYGNHGPFLILAPLSTLGHWKREVEDWCDLRSVYYHDPVGGAEAR